MKLKHLAMVLACLAWSLTQAVPAAAQQEEPAQGGTEIVLRVCNTTGDPARVAVSYEPVGSARFYNEGWFRVPARSCQDLIHTDNGYIYGYAEVENDGNRTWSGDHGLCVIYPGPFAFWSDDTATCADGQDARNFVVLHTDNFGAFEWTLDQPK